MMYPTDYFLIAMLMMLLISFSSQSLESVIKMMLWNYILMAISLWMNSWMDFLKYFVVNLQGLMSFVDMNKVITLLVSRKMWMNMLLYFLILVLVMLQSKISMWNMESKMKSVLLKMILCPLSVLMTLVALEMVMLGYKMFDVNSLLQTLWEYKINGKLYYFSLMTPLWMIISWLITMMMSLKADFKFSFKSGWAHASADHWHWWDDHGGHH